jgi:hypothetical protein
MGALAGRFGRSNVLPLSLSRAERVNAVNPRRAHPFQSPLLGVGEPFDAKCIERRVPRLETGLAPIDLGEMRERFRRRLAFLRTIAGILPSKSASEISESSCTHVPLLHPPFSCSRDA